MDKIPLKIVYDEIATPPGTTTIASGTIMVVMDAGGSVISSTRVQELTARLDELTRKGRQAVEAIRNGVLSPVSMAVPDDQA